MTAFCFNIPQTDVEDKNWSYLGNMAIAWRGLINSVAANYARVLDMARPQQVEMYVGNVWTGPSPLLILCGLGKV